MTNWRLTTLGDEIELAYGKGLPSHVREAGLFPVYGSNGIVGQHSKGLITGPGIIVGRKGSAGEVAYSPGPFWPIDTTYFVVNHKNHDWRFLYHLLRAQHLDDLNSHSAVPGLNREDVYSIEVAFPPVAEQKAIAMIIDTVEASADLEAQALAKATKLKSVMMSNLFTHGLRGEAQQQYEIGLAPETWRMLPISELGQVVTGNTPPTKDISNYAGGKVPFVAPGDIEHGTRIIKTDKLITEQGLARARPINEGAICFVCIGSTIGKVGYVTFPVCATNQQINSIIPHAGFDSLFVFYLLTFWADHVRRRASPSPVPILSKGAFEQIEIPMPADLGEQREVAAILNSIDRKLEAHKAKQSALGKLHKLVLQKLINCEISVTDFSAFKLQSATQASA